MSKLREAAMAVIDRRQSRYWTHDAIPTGILIANLLDAVNEDALNEMQALTESEYRENTLACLSNTHQQLGEQLGEQPPQHWDQLVANLMRYGMTKSTAKEVATGLMAMGWRRCAEGQGETQYCALLEAAVLAEREACAQICEEEKALRLAEIIRARGGEMRKVIFVGSPEASSAESLAQLDELMQDIKTKVEALRDALAEDRQKEEK